LDLAENLVDFIIKFNDPHLVGVKLYALPPTEEVSVEQSLGSHAWSVYDQAKQKVSDGETHTNISYADRLAHIDLINTVKLVKIQDTINKETARETYYARAYVWLVDSLTAQNGRIVSLQECIEWIND
jgi:hypothetical protein